MTGSKVASTRGVRVNRIIGLRSGEVYVRPIPGVGVGTHAQRTSTTHGPDPANRLHHQLQLRKLLVHVLTLRSCRHVHPTVAIDISDTIMMTAMAVIISNNIINQQYEYLLLLSLSVLSFTMVISRILLSLWLRLRPGVQIGYIATFDL